VIFKVGGQDRGLCIRGPSFPKVVIGKLSSKKGKVRSKECKYGVEEVTFLLFCACLLAPHFFRDGSPIRKTSGMIARGGTPLQAFCSLEIWQCLKDTIQGLLNITGPNATFALKALTTNREWECSKKFDQQGHSHFDARSVHGVREHGEMARTPLAAFFNIPIQVLTLRSC